MGKHKAETAKSGMEIIAIKIDDEICRTYQGFSGTFAGLVYSCIDKKVLPGFYQKGLVKKATIVGQKLELSLSGKHTQVKLADILDSALLNMVAFPHEGSEAQFFIDAKSNKKGR